MALPEIIPSHDPYQALRVKRFLMAILLYVMVVGLMGLYVREGFMPARSWLGTTAAIVAVNAVFYVVMRSGRNEGLRDPSLTGLQMIAACVLMGVTVYQVNTARGPLLLLFLVLLMFGVFRLRTRQFMAVGLLALLCYGAAIAAVHWLRPWAVDLQLELLQLAALAAIVPCGGFFAGYVGQLRRALRERQVELQRAREQVHELTLQDELTGIRNRRSIFEFLDHERERAERLDSPLAVLILDLDRFKALNRRFGHVSGDQVLRILATRLRQAVRTVDGLGRSGGEEFLIVMPDTTAELAAGIAERLRQRVEQCRFHNLDPTLRITLSVGVTDQAPGDEIWSLVERARYAADRALERGGNCIVVEQGARAGR